MKHTRSFLVARIYSILERLEHMQTEALCYTWPDGLYEASEEQLYRILNHLSSVQAMVNRRRHKYNGTNLIDIDILFVEKSQET